MAFFFFGFKCLIYGTVASGDMDTTLGNTLTIIIIWVITLSRHGINLDQVFLRVAGDDSLILLPSELLDVVLKEAELAYRQFGLPVKLASGDFFDQSAPPQFCSKMFIPYEHEGELRVRHFRLLSRSIIRFGWTVIPNLREREKLGLLRAKALSEMTWASGFPVMGAYFAATLARPEVSGADLVLSREMVRNVVTGNVPVVDELTDRSDCSGQRERLRKRQAKAILKRAPVSSPEPEPGLRAAFAVLTGIPVEHQLMLEETLAGYASRGTVQIPDSAFMGLIRDDWL